MNILFACDTNYVIPLTVCITSIFENNKDSNICVYVLYSTMTTKQKDVLRELATQYGQKINPIEIEPHYFSKAPALRWSKETYYRLLVNEVLPNNLDRVLYLDCDIIVNKSLKDFYNSDFEDNYMVARNEKEQEKQSRTRLELSKEGKYFQAGVILFNLKKCRGYLSYESSSKVIEDLGDRLLIVDQDVANVMFDGHIKDMEQKFNNWEIANFNKSNLNRFFNYTNKIDLENTIVIHYSTGKPWNNLYSGSCEDIWYKYLKLSPYKELYDSKFNKLKYKIIRLGFFKLLFFKYIDITPLINKVALTLFPRGLYQKLKAFYRKNIK